MEPRTVAGAQYLSSTSFRSLGECSGPTSNTRATSSTWLRGLRLQADAVRNQGCREAPRRSPEGVIGSSSSEGTVLTGSLGDVAP